jgi:DNA-directed RNA polymerase subunit alpha
MKTMWANFQKPKRIESDRDSLSDVRTLIAEPFERGFGVTIGNALRRVLLSSLTGAAVGGQNRGLPRVFHYSWRLRMLRKLF